jgi:hypothetical protein
MSHGTGHCGRLHEVMSLVVVADSSAKDPPQPARETARTRADIMSEVVFMTTITGQLGA